MKDINYNCVLFRMILSLLVVMTWENALGETYSIDFNTGSNTSSRIGESTLASTVLNSGIEYVTRQPFTANCDYAYYKTTNGLRLGSDSQAGIIEINLSADYQKAIKKITIKSSKYGTKNSVIDLYAYIDSKSQKLAGSITPGTDYSYTFTIPKQLTIIKLQTEVGGAYISEISIETDNRVTISLNPACTDGTNVYGTYSSSLPFIIPQELSVYEVGVESDFLIVKKYDADAVVPANTGVMVSAEKGGDYLASVAEGESANSATSLMESDNCLKPSGDNGKTQGGMSNVTPNCTYYRLTMHNGTQIGYWWGAEDGGAFDLAANKAYLAVPKSQSVKVNLWLSDIVTSIDATRKKKSNDAMYNLVGQRVNDAVKGIYIKNGKKYMMK